MTLVDTEGKGVTAITATSVIANGEEYPVDCIIFATGFEVGTGFSRRAGYDVEGKDGVMLSQKWSDGIQTLHGLHSHGFPNLLIMSNAQSAFTTNFPMPWMRMRGIWRTCLIPAEIGPSNNLRPI